MQKEIETEQTIRFLVTFLSLMTFQLRRGNGGAPVLTLATPMSRVMLRSHSLFTVHQISVNHKSLHLAQIQSQKLFTKNKSQSRFEK